MGHQLASQLQYPSPSFPFPSGLRAFRPRLLRMMGWKDGQGVGPRVDAIFRTTHNEGSSRHGIDNHAATHGLTFAPRDVKTTAFAAKDNFFGIGYRGIAASDYHMGGGPRAAGGGIGVGAMEVSHE